MYIYIHQILYSIYILDCQETVRIMECACSVFRVLCENEDWFYSMVGLCWYQLHLRCIDASCISHKDMKSHGPTWKPMIWQFPEIRMCLCALFVQYILCSLSQYISTHTPCISCDLMFVSHSRPCIDDCDLESIIWETSLYFTQVLIFLQRRWHHSAGTFFLKLASWGVQRWDTELFGKIRQSWQSLAWWVNTLDSNRLLPNFVMFSFAVDFVLHRSERVLPYTPTAFDSGVSCPYSKRSHWDEAVQDPQKLPEGVNKLTDFKVCSYLAIARLAMLQPGATWTNCICCELLQCALESGWISSWWKGWWISP